MPTGEMYSCLKTVLKLPSFETNETSLNIFSQPQK